MSLDRTLTDNKKEMRQEKLTGLKQKNMSEMSAEQRMSRLNVLLCNSSFGNWILWSQMEVNGVIIICLKPKSKQSWVSLVKTGFANFFYQKKQP
jgi:uncharacterized protein YceH (UPF0502 family)